MSESISDKKIFKERLEFYTKRIKDKHNHAAIAFELAYIFARDSQSPNTSNPLKFGGLCEKHLSLYPCTKCSSTESQQQDAIDAKRYRFLRDQFWESSNLFVVQGSKDNIVSGTYCPNQELLDVAVDEILSGK